MTGDSRLQRLRKRYTGDVAATYERTRASQARWKQEQKYVAGYVSELNLPANELVLDVPIGTGRFLEDYKRAGLRVLGVDVSRDMIRQTQARITSLGLETSLVAEGDILRLPLRDGSVPVSICVRLLNWFEVEGMQRAVSELGRVTAEYAIIGIRMRTRRTVGGTKWVKHLPAFGYHLMRQLMAKNRDDLTVVVHDEAEVLRAFEKSRLTIVDSVLVDVLTEQSVPTSWKTVYGFPKRIFLLEKC